MNLTFFRSQTIGSKIGKPEDPRAFVFDLEFGVSGVSGEVDPLTGMAVSLIEVDKQLCDLRDYLSTRLWHSFEELLFASVDWLSIGEMTQTLQLKELLFVEKRGVIFGWSEGHYFMGSKVVAEFSGEIYGLKSKFNFNEVRFLSLPHFDSMEEIESGKVFENHPDLISLEIEDFVRGGKVQYLKSSSSALGQKNLGRAHQK